MKWASLRVLRFVAAAVLVAMTFVVFLELGPKVEAKFFPIAGEWEPIETSVSEEGYPVFRLLFSRYRDACQFSYIFWFALYRDNTDVLVSYEVTPAHISYPAGPRHRSMIFTVKVPKDAPFFYAAARYNCPATPWVSTVRIGPFENWAVQP
jgi:hypothetical protein